MQTVVETPQYLSVAQKLFNEAELEDIVWTVAAEPKCGDVMTGTGGFRKFRVARSGMGKRGGGRVVYIFRDDTFPLFLVTVFAKNATKNLTKAERNALKKRADDIFSKYRRRP